ncbi:MAG: transposase [Ruminococcus sp.]|nr:transposase [Ruminococcus sp.]
MPNRKHPRLDNFDYSSDGAYFITICTQNKKCLLSRIVEQEPTLVEVEYTEYGKVAKKQLLLLEQRYPFVQVAQYVIMPNHIHIILVIENTAPKENFRTTVSDIICAYKSLTTRECKKISPVEKVFQTSFYEHIIRGKEDYEEIVKYIYENPLRWKFDKMYSEEYT